MQPVTMSDLSRLEPSRPVPPLRVKTVGGPCWRLCDQKPKHFTLIQFYRGLHCRLCEAQLREFEARYDDFCKLGVRVLAVSTDDHERAERAVAEWGLDKLTVCWGLSLEQAKLWGLYISDGRGVSNRGVTEPERFVEPALFLVRPDGTLYGGIVQTMPMARPRIDDLLDGIRDVVVRELGSDACACGCAAPTVDHLISTA